MTDEERDQHEHRGALWSFAALAGAILLAMATILGLHNQDQEARAHCVNVGGHVVEVHEFSRQSAWVCVRDYTP